MKFFFYIIAVLVFIGRGTASAGDFDGSKLLICATVDAMDCVSGEDCTKGRPGDMGAPAFLRVDFVKKTIGGPKRSVGIIHDFVGAAKKNRGAIGVSIANHFFSFSDHGLL
jgi:hypothetical protein